MTALWLPFHNAALSLSLLQLLLFVHPCLAFRQPHLPLTPRWTNPGGSGPGGKVSPVTTSLWASGSEGSSEQGEAGLSSNLAELLIDGEEPKLQSKFSTERRRKLVDRSNVYNMHSAQNSTSTDSSSKHIEPISNYSASNVKSKLVLEEEEEEDLSYEEEDEEELCYLDDMPGTDAGQTCFVSDSSSLSSDPTSDELLASLPFNVRIQPIAMELALKYLPFIMPLFAYSTYELTAKLFDETVQLMSHNNWVAVDGGQYQANIITPAINGLVVPSIALLFATLMSNTINTLRQRQLQIRTSLNTEANDLRMLSTMVDSLPPDMREAKNHLREYLIQYASRVIAESKPGLSEDLQTFIGSMDSEMNGFLGLWNKISMSSYGTMYVDTMLPASNYTVDESHFDPYQKQLGLSPQQRQRIAPFLSPTIFSETYDALTRLRHERSVRLSSLQTTYPALHYLILGLLGGSICTVFLMETNQELLIFLSAIQLRILWSMLIGTFSALAVVNYDMRDPFQGSYNVAVSVDQFYTIREAIRATIQMDQEICEHW